MCACESDVRACVRAKQGIRAALLYIKRVWIMCISCVAARRKSSKKRQKPIM